MNKSVGLLFDVVRRARRKWFKGSFVRSLALMRRFQTTNQSDDGGTNSWTHAINAILHTYEKRPEHLNVYYTRNLKHCTTYLVSNKSLRSCKSGETKISTFRQKIKSYGKLKSRRQFETPCSLLYCRQVVMAMRIAFHRMRIWEMRSGICRTMANNSCKFTQKRPSRVNPS